MSYCPRCSDLITELENRTAKIAALETALIDEQKHRDREAVAADNRIAALEARLAKVPHIHPQSLGHLPNDYERATCAHIGGACATLPDGEARR